MVQVAPVTLTQNDDAGEPVVATQSFVARTKLSTAKLLCEQLRVKQPTQMPRRPCYRFLKIEKIGIGDFFCLLLNL